ncbi:MAG: TonB-dependent receptor domain-containing protein [Candidatus Binatia bacterium]
MISSVQAPQAGARTAQAGGTISGRIVDTGNTQPLSGALVTLVPLRAAAGPGDSAGAPSNLSQQTGPDGAYRFTAVATGRYRLLITLPGYRPRTLEVEVGGAANLNLLATLQVETLTLEVLNQDTTTVVTGRVVDAKSARPVTGVEVSVEGTELRTVTDAEGRYWLVGVPPGPQVLRTRRIGFAPARVSIVVPREGTITRDIRIAASALMIAGVVVTADPAGRARGELGTASVIDHEAIRHETATSLATILELVPGVQLQPPGLDQVQQIPLRVAPTSGSGAAFGTGTRSDDLASFGTLVVLDGVPMSNNANLQSLGPRGELDFTTSAGGGIDLRQIPATTLERVEVIRGVPSARLGDLTQGAIIVDTRAGEVEPEVSSQFDIRTAEVTVVGGRRLTPTQTATWTFDFARTRNSPGRSDDNADRIAGQILHRAEIGSITERGVTWPKLTLDTRFDFFQLLDDRPANPNTGRTRTSFSRDRGFRLIERLRLRLTDRTRLSITGAATAVRQRSRATADLTRSALPFTDRLTEGRQEGRFLIGPFMSRVDVDGNPWLGFGRVELASEQNALGANHKLLGGFELRREWNSGPGTQFDIEFPPQSTFNGVQGFDRPRDNREIPALSTSAVYVDDRIRESLGSATLQLQAGLRVDMLHDGSYWTSGVRDAVLEPRFNAELSPFKWLRFRGGWGRTAKTPSLGALYPAPQFFDVVNVNQFTNDPAERLAVVTTIMRDPTNPDLDLTRATKAEAGVEVGIGASALSFVLFRDRISGGVSIRQEPAFILRDRFALTDSVIGNGIKPDIIEPPSSTDTIPILIQRPANIITQRNRGFEIVASLPELKAIHTRLQITGSWVETKQQTGALFFGRQNDFSDFQLLETDPRTPFWEGVTEIGKRVLFMYRLVHQEPQAGLVISATIQHNITDDIRDAAGTDTLAFLGFLTRDAQLVTVPKSERGRDEFRDLRQPRGGTLLTFRGSPADYLLSVQVSKTLPLDGRLNFWAFNLLDRRGTTLSGTVQPRIFAPVRVGLRVSLPMRVLIGQVNP